MNKIFFSYLLMHIGFLLYSFYSLMGKFASKYDFLSINFCIFYCILIFILFLYALLWQQVLKHIDLSIATAQKSVTIIWGMLWGILFFNETLSLKKIIAVSIIIFGIVLLAYGDNKNEK